MINTAKINKKDFDNLLISSMKIIKMYSALEKSLKDTRTILRENNPSWNEEEIEDFLNTLTEEEIKNGYTFAIGYGKYPDATCIKKIDELGYYETDEDAADVYVANGGKLIDTEKLDDFYIDNDENRKILSTHISKETKDEVDYIKYDPEIGADKKWEELCDNLFNIMKKYNKKGF